MSDVTSSAVAALSDGGRGAGGQDQQRAEAARDAAARVDQQAHRDGVDAELEAAPAIQRTAQRRWIVWMQTRPKAK